MYLSIYRRTIEINLSIHASTEGPTEGRDRQTDRPPGRTCPQSCRVSDVRLVPLLTLTTPWLKPCINWGTGQTDRQTDGWTDRQTDRPPGRTCPQSCRVSDVRLVPLLTLTTPWLKPCIDNTPRPDGLVPSRHGLTTSAPSHKKWVGASQWTLPGSVTL